MLEANQVDGIISGKSGFRGLKSPTIDVTAPIISFDRNPIRQDIPVV